MVFHVLDSEVVESPRQEEKTECQVQETDYVMEKSDNLSILPLVEQEERTYSCIYRQEQTFLHRYSMNICPRVLVI